MHKIHAFLTFCALTLTATVAFAGGPEASSPEPSFWAFLALGLIPFAVYVARQKAQSTKAVPVHTKDA